MPGDQHYRKRCNLMYVQVFHVSTFKTKTIIIFTFFLSNRFNKYLLSFLYFQDINTLIPFFIIIISKFEKNTVSDSLQSEVGLVSKSAVTTKLTLIGKL